MLAEQLIDAAELHARLDDANWSIIDCRFDLADPTAGRRAYDTAHIPGAVFMDLNNDLAGPLGEYTGRHPLPNVANLTTSIGQLGISNHTTIVVYDSGDGAIASRAWWTLRWLGHLDIRLLDGGLAAWQESRFCLSSAAVKTVPAEFVSNVQDKFVITTAEICDAQANIADLNILDARDVTRFAGEAEPIDKVAGHIPGARNLPYPMSMSAGGRWKSRAALRELWHRTLGDDCQAEWVAMCGSGVTACHLALSALEAGYREPRLYVGSWSEWITDSRRPIGAGYG